MIYIIVVGSQPISLLVLPLCILYQEKMLYVRYVQYMEEYKLTYLRIFKVISHTIIICIVKEYITTLDLIMLYHMPEYGGCGSFHRH